MARSAAGRLITVDQTKEARLEQLGIDPARRLELEAAGAGPGHGRALDAVAYQQVAGPPGLVGRLSDRLAALVPAAQVLGGAVIGLQSSKGEVGCFGDTAGEIECRLARLDPAAVAAHIDLDIDRQGHPGFACGSVDGAHLAFVVGAHADSRGLRQRGQPPQFLPADDFVGDEDIPDPAIDHRLGLADLLHAHPHRAQLDLL
jgi:hypothetical protein